jgi:hypothetical protein
MAIINRRLGDGNSGSHLYQPLHHDHASFGLDLEFGLADNPTSRNSTSNLDITHMTPSMQPPDFHEAFGDSPGPVSWREAPPSLSTAFTPSQHPDSYCNEDLNRFTNGPPSMDSGYSSNSMGIYGVAEAVDTDGHAICRPQTKDSQASTLSSMFSSSGPTQSSDGSSVEYNPYLTSIPNTAGFAWDQHLSSNIYHD